MIVKLLMSAPDNQLSRAQIIYRDYISGNISNAVFTALMSARETTDSNKPWSNLCIEFVVSQLKRTENASVEEKLKLVSSLVDFAGHQFNSETKAVDQAVFISSIAIANGDNQLQALTKATSFLKQPR